MEVDKMETDSAIQNAQAKEKELATVNHVVLFNF